MIDECMWNEAWARSKLWCLDIIVKQFKSSPKAQIKISNCRREQDNYSFLLTHKVWNTNFLINQQNIDLLRYIIIIVKKISYLTLTYYFFFKHLILFLLLLLRTIPQNNSNVKERQVFDKSQSLPAPLLLISFARSTFEWRKSLFSLFNQ